MPSRLPALALVALLLTSGCAHVLSREALQSVDRTVAFAEVKADPAAFRARTLLLGGLIVDVRPGETLSTLEILRYSIDRWGEPRRPDEAGGRFLVVADRFLDPELYKPGYFITLTGTVSGEEEHELNGVPYRYPVFRLGEAFLWQRPAAGAYPYRGSLYLYPFPYYDPWWYYSPYYWYPPPPRRESYFEHRRDHPIGKGD